MMSKDVFIGICINSEIFCVFLVRVFNVRIWFFCLYYDIVLILKIFFFLRYLYVVDCLVWMVFKKSADLNIYKISILELRILV